MGNILVKIKKDEQFISLSTYEREFGRRERFLFFVSDWMEKTTDANFNFWDHDCGNIAHVVDRGDYVEISVHWISMQGERRFVGFTQNLQIPVHYIKNVLSGNDVTLVTNPNKFINPKIDFSHAQRTLSNIIPNKQDRRALSKFLRDHFHWSGDKITLYNDGKFDFYFSSEGTFSLCGGVILHEGTKKTCNGDYKYVYFGVHT